MPRARSFLARVAAFALGTAAVSSVLCSSARAEGFHMPGINYNARLGPDWAVRCKDAAAVASDMAALSRVADAVRLFSLSDCAQAELVVPAAISQGLRVSLGLWVGRDDAVFDAERAQLEALLRSRPEWFTGGQVADVHVGSEAIYRGDVTVEQNIAKLQQVRALLVEHGVSEVPVTIAEIGDTYLASDKLVEAVDVVQANAFPFWEKVPVERAAAYLRARMEPLLRLASAKNKRVEIGETGWASQGAHVNASEASAASAGRYLASFRALASTYGWKYYYFEAFDAAWKAETAGSDTVEAHFGLFSADRVLKSGLASDSSSSSSSSTGRSNNNNSSSSSNNSSSNRTDSSSAFESAPASVSAAATATDAAADNASTGASNPTSRPLIEPTVAPAADGGRRMCRPAT